MKLYTEEQIRKAYIDGMDFIAVDPTMYEQDADEYMNSITPIELPSDEEIEKQAEDCAWGVIPFTMGAKWMRDKIGGNNEQRLD